jgi:dolichol-phosphate mannosyltransferase
MLAGDAASRSRLDVVLPVHNEAKIIASVIDEIFDRTRDRFDVRVLACEDGSTDGTQQVLAELSARLPVVVRSCAQRRGYTPAVTDGVRAAGSEWVLVMDSDGQCNPADIERLWAARGEPDIVIGNREPRRDHVGRRIASRAFALLYRALFDVAVGDPSCPFVLLRRARVLPLLDGLGRMPYGLWWELIATAQSRGLKIAEVPITHRPRAAGRTRAFQPRAVPRAAATQVGGLVRVWLALRRRN